MFHERVKYFMNKYKKLLNNSFVFAIGNFGSKLMQFIMVPLYSYTLNTSDFGKVDVLTTVVTLLTLVICLDIPDAVFRFSLDRDGNRREIFSIGLIVVAVTSMLTIIIAIPIANTLRSYPVIYTAILLISNMFFSLISNFARAINFVKQFATAGIINTFCMGILNLVLLLHFKMGMNGYMLSMILGLVFASFYLVMVCKLFSYFSFSYFSTQTFRKMIRYSLPLIPNGFAWWLNSASDRIFILTIIGAGANGIYAMANKIPSMLNLVTSIFFQSWQISAVEEYDNEESKIFITNVFNTFLSVLFAFSLIIMALVRIIFKLFINSNYYGGWKLTPLLLLAVIYVSIASFLGTIYTATKKTGRVFSTTVYGAVVNVILTLVTLPIIGIAGAALANIVSFAIVSFFRLKDIIKMNKIIFDWKKFMLLNFIYIIASLVSLGLPNILSIVIIMSLVIVQCLIDKNMHNIIISLLSSLKF